MPSIIIPFKGPRETNKNLIGVTDKYREYELVENPTTNKQKMDNAIYDLISPIVTTCGENFSRKELWDKCGGLFTSYDELLELIGKGKDRGLLEEIRLRRK